MDYYITLIQIIQIELRNSQDTNILKPHNKHKLIYPNPDTSKTNLYNTNLKLDNLL